jgi:tRNA U34 5-carboxymethylaminomethyl modifying GTPase MnmE/TrmE
VQARAKANLVNDASVNRLVNAETRRGEEAVVETAAAAIVQVVRGHRNEIAKARAMAEKLMHQLDAMQKTLDQFWLAFDGIKRAYVDQDPLYTRWRNGK